MDDKLIKRLAKALGYTKVHVHDGSFMVPLKGVIHPANDAELFQKCLVELTDNRGIILSEEGEWYITCRDITYAGASIEEAVYTAFCEMKEAEQF